MVSSRKVVPIAVLLILALVTACTPECIGCKVETPSTPEIFVFPGPTEEIIIASDDISQDNCDGSAERSDTIERVHMVSRTLDLGTQITVDASGQAGIPGVGQVGVGVAVADFYQVGYGSQDAVRRMVVVAAEEGTNILHTVRQYELWETGEVLISAGGVNERIPYRFRKDFSMETLPPANQGCPGSNAPSADLELSTQAGAAIAPEQQSEQPRVTAPVNAIPGCQEIKGDSLSPLPTAPPNGCVLIIEWWYPPDAEICGLMVTLNAPALPDNPMGTWWYTYPARPDAHIEEFRQKYPHCSVNDQR